MTIWHDVTWAEAEELFPGCGAEWDLMVLRPELVEGPGPGTHGPVDEVNLSIEQRSDGKCLLRVTQRHDPGTWLYPPCWVRGESGVWYSTLPMPKLTMFRREYGDWEDYK